MSSKDDFVNVSAIYGVYNVAKAIKEQRETKRWNSLYDELHAHEKELNDYLRSKGVLWGYTSDVQAVNNGNIQSEISKMDAIRRKFDRYLAMGGSVNYVHDIEYLDDATEALARSKR